jgi:hypothetical protein
LKKSSCVAAALGVIEFLTIIVINWGGRGVQNLQSCLNNLFHVAGFPSGTIIVEESPSLSRRKQNFDDRDSIKELNWCPDIFLAVEVLYNGLTLSTTAGAKIS